MAEYPRRPTTMHEALRYVSKLSWPIVLLAPGEKVPFAKSRGFLDATADADRLEQRFAQYPNSNIGVATGRSLLVLDEDPRNGGDQSLERLSVRGFSLPACPVSMTGNGGRHFYLYAPIELGCRTNVWPGIDIKARGGYVVLPPSVIRRSKSGAGGTYRWLVDPFNTPLPVAPSWLLAKINPLSQGFRRSDRPTLSPEGCEGLVRAVANATEGNRNAVLNWAAFHAAGLVARNIVPQEYLLSSLKAAALAAGLGAGEIEATIASGYRAGVAKLGARQ